MSADNGVYILKTKARFPEIDSDYEYRVTHAQAIENIHWDQEKGDYREDGRFTPEIAFDYFGRCQVFRTSLEATQFAHALADDIDILEYGVCVLDHKDQIFETFSEKEIEEFERRGDELMEERRQERQREIEADLAERTVRIPRNTYVTVRGGIAFSDPEDDTDQPEQLTGMIKGDVVVLLHEDVEVIRNK